MWQYERDGIDRLLGHQLVVCLGNLPVQSHFRTVVVVRLYLYEDCLVSLWPI